MANSYQYRPTQKGHEVYHKDKPEPPIAVYLTFASALKVAAFLNGEESNEVQDNKPQFD